MQNAAAAAVTAKPQPAARGPEHFRREWAALADRIANQFPEPAKPMLRAGLQKVVDFQDVRYGGEYLDRLLTLYKRDRRAGGEAEGFRFTAEAAKYVANAMAYDDVIRVADLKTRSARLRRIEKEMDAGADKVLRLTEFMHPRVEEVCGTLPAPLGGFIMKRPQLVAAMNRVVNKGRHVRTDKIRWFLALYALAGLRRFRRSTLRHRIETAHLEEWLRRATGALDKHYRLGVEVLRARRLIKGYSDTHARGESKYDRVLAALPVLSAREDGADWLRRLIEAALKDEDGTMLDGALKTVKTL
jgi:indolepyruvate ferredoxin oxidoreductase beta subunit